MKTYVFLLLLFLCFSYNALTQTIIGRQTADQYRITSGGSKTYGLTWLPEDYNSTSKTYPLIIFLHAAGEVGNGVSGLNNLIRLGLPKKIADGWNPQAVNPEDGKTYQFIVVSPQAPTSSGWSYTYTHVLYMLSDVIKRYRIDTSRIYITGESAGGAGTWSCVTNDSNFTKKIAAIIPVSAVGVNNPNAEYKNIKYISGKYGVKVWTICGTQDGFYNSVAIPYVNLINTASPAPNVPAQLTGVPKYGHDSALWNIVYDPSWKNNALKLNFYEWMLQYHRGSSIPAPNKVPVANAGTNKTITLPANSVALSGSGSDSDGTIKAYKWSKVNGPLQFTITSSAQAQTTVTGLVEGTYRFELKVTDDDNASSADTVTVTVLPEPNKTPVVDAGSNISIKLPKNAVTLKGSASDPDGTIISYEWKKIAGPDDFSISTPDDEQTSVTGLTEGIYEFEFSAADDSSATSKDTVAVTVLAANKAPVANAGTNKTTTLPDNSVTLKGTATDDDGTIVSYTWSFVDGPAQYIIATPSQAQTVVNNLVEGTYSFELKVEDDDSFTNADTVTVTVLPEPNKTPVVDAGSNISIKLPKNAVTLTGAASDSDGTIISYEWKKIAGPDDFSISNPDAEQTAVTGLTEGIYQFEFSAADDSSVTSKDTVAVTVLAANKAPVANAGTNKTTTLPDNSVTLKGTATDDDGTIVSYTWSFVDGPAQYSIATPSQAQTVVNNLVEGTYSFELKVADDDSSTNADTVTVTVLPEPNKTPVVDAGSNISIKLPKNTVTLTGAASDSDGSIISYEWKKIAGPDDFSISTPDAEQTSVKGLTEGIYEFEFSAADDSSAISKDTVTITVFPVNVAPVVDAGNDQTIALPNNVTLSGKATDADGTIASYKWSQINGPSIANIISAGTAKTVVNSLESGVYQFELKATDDDNASGADTVTITVLLVANTPPVASAGDDHTITLPWKTATLQGSGTDTDGTIASFAWTKISGPSQYSISNSNTEQATANNLVAGTYVFKLTVVDNSGDSSTDDVSIIVQAALTGYKAIPGRIEAESYNSMSGIKTETTADTSGKIDIGWIDNGDWMNYNVYVDSSGLYTVNFRIATASSNGKLQLRKADGTVLATIDIPNTASYQGWCTRSAVVNLPQGYQTLRVVSTAAIVWNFNWIEFVRGTSTGTPIPARVQAEDYSQMSGIQMEPVNDTGGGLDVGWLNNGDWLDYNVNAASEGTYTVKLRLATPNSGASLQIRKSDGSVLATMNIPKTGGYQTWATASTSISIPAGQQTLRIVCTSTKDWNINWFEFVGNNSLVAESSNNVSDAQQAASLAETASFKIFPNPVKDKFALEVSSNSTGLMHVQISSINGTMVKEFTFNKSVRGTQNFNLSAYGLRPGSYIVHLKAADLNGSQMLIKK